MAEIDVFAAAKVNLALHVTGRRRDGYHLLDSLVVFADIGDSLRISTADDLSLAVTGPFAGDIRADADNLVLQAARMMGGQNGAEIVLDKHLPVASGIGGGSADAAAALRGLAHLWHLGLPTNMIELGADVPVCLNGRPCRMRGTGEILDPIDGFPEVWAVLANPGVAVATAEVFAALHSRENEAMPDTLPKWSSAADLASWLSTQRNDLQAAARQIAPVIGDVLDALDNTPGCRLARMSGSGATCFGLYSSRAEAEQAADGLAKSQTGWWVRPTRLGAAGVSVNLA